MAVPCYIQVADVCHMFYKLPYCRRRACATILTSSCSKAPMQSEKQSNRQNKKNRSQNSGDFVFYIEFSMHDFSQLLRRKSIKTSLSNFSLATEKRQFPTMSLSVSIFMRFLSTYLIIRHFCLFNMANCRLLLVFFSNTRSMKRLLE